MRKGQFKKNDNNNDRKQAGAELWQAQAKLEVEVLAEA